MFMTPLVGFFMMLLVSMIFSMMSHSLFFFWLSLEINMLMIIPLLTVKDSFFSNEIALKYFISQSAASILFLAFSLIFLLNSSYFSMLALFSVLIFKLGIPPFQSWFVSIMMTGSYPILWLLSSTQKLIPLQILSFFNLSEKLILGLSFLVFFFVIFSMKNIISVRVMLIMSTFGNSIWMITAVNISNSWLTYLLVYSFLLATALYMCYNLSIETLSSTLIVSPLSKLILGLSFLNLAGLPPFSGFLIKLILLKSFLLFTPAITIFVLLMVSLLILYTYLAVMFFSYTMNFSTSYLNLSAFSYVLSVVSLSFLPVLGNTFLWNNNQMWYLICC